MAVLSPPVAIRPRGADAAAAGGRPEGTAPGPTGSGRWAAPLVAVGVVYAGSSFAVTRTMGWGRDEVVYLSQVSPFSRPAYFSAPRARGITWLVAPIAHLTNDVTTIRLCLAVLSGMALVACLWPWLRVRGLGSPAVPAVAGGLFASLWLARFYATQVMPNLWIAFGAVGAFGLLLRLAQADGFRWWRLGLLGLVLCGVAMLRPSDAAALAGALALTALLVMRRRWRHALATVTVLGLGAVAGAVPWVLEAQQRFGGVAARLHRAEATEGGVGFGLRLSPHLRVMDGPLLCRPTCRALGQPIPLHTWVLVGTAAALVLLGVLLAWRQRDPSAALAPTVGAVALGTPYLTVVGYAAPRFLLPAYALASLPVALALVTLVRRAPGRWRLLALAVVLAILGLHLGHQQAVLQREAAGQDAKRARIELVADFLRSKGIRPGCVVSGVQAPQIAHALGCSSTAVSGHDANITRAQLLRLASTTQVVLVRRGHVLTPPGWAAGAWTGAQVPGLPRTRALVVFVPSGRP